MKRPRDVTPPARAAVSAVGKSQFTTRRLLWVHIAETVSGTGILH